MARNDILFSAHLNYQINASNSDKTGMESYLFDNINDINLHKCAFFDFRRAMIYAKMKNPDFSFSDSSIESVKPNDFVEGQKYDFVRLTDVSKNTAVTIGNITLFSELQKISSAIDFFISNYSLAESKKNSNVISFQNYDNYDIKQQPIITEELGSCVISGGNDGSVKISATLHDSSTNEHPIISIQFFSLGTRLYMSNRDIIDIDNIYMPNASIIETFAYLSYMDYQHNLYNHSFDSLLINGEIELDCLDDLYAKHYDLREYKNSE